MRDILADRRRYAVIAMRELIRSGRYRPGEVPTAFVADDAFAIADAMLRHDLDSEGLILRQQQITALKGGERDA